MEPNSFELRRQSSLTTTKGGVNVGERIPEKLAAISEGLKSIEY